jgi:hypothetical protein
MDKAKPIVYCELTDSVRCDDDFSIRIDSMETEVLRYAPPTPKYEVKSYSLEPQFFPREPTYDEYVWKMAQSCPLPSVDEPLREWAQVMAEDMNTHLDSPSVSLAFLLERFNRADLFLFRPIYLCILIHFVDFHHASTQERNRFQKLIQHARSSRSVDRTFPDYCESVWIQQTAVESLTDKTLFTWAELAYENIGPGLRSWMVDEFRRQEFTKTPSEYYTRLHREYTKQINNDHKSFESNMSVMLVHILPNLIKWSTADFTVIDEIVKLCNRSRWYITLTNVLNALGSVFDEKQIRSWRQPQEFPTCTSCWYPILVKLRCIDVKNVS